MPDAVAPASSVPAGLLELFQQRPAAVEPVEGQVGPEVADGAELEPALGGDAAIGLEVVPDLVGERLAWPSGSPWPTNSVQIGS